MLLAGFALLLAACTTPPIQRVGVLAPFEGLYRRSGYNALAVTRFVLESSGDGLLPLALDTSRDPARALAKVRAATDLGAVVGPLTPQEAAGGAEILAGVPWFAPWALTSEGWSDPASDQWLTELVGAAAEDARNLGVRSLAVAGMAASAQGEIEATLPLVWIDSPLALRSGDGVLWLGDGAGGARFVTELRSRLPGTPVWLAPWVDPAVFSEHLQAAGPVDWKRIYWIGWLDRAYAAWASTHAGGDPLAYLMERVARHAVAVVQGQADAEDSWRPHLFEFTPSTNQLHLSR